jgi:hypothetical protein
MLWLRHYESIPLTKWSLGLKMIIVQGSVTTFILSVIWTATTDADWGRGLPSFLPLARTGLLDSIRLLDHLWQWKTSLSRLMIATHQVGEKMTWGLFNKEGLTWVWLVESGGYNIYQKLLSLILSYKLFSSKHNIEPTTKSTVVVWPKRTDWPTIPTMQRYHSRLV